MQKYEKFHTIDLYQFQKIRKIKRGQSFKNDMIFVLLPPNRRINGISQRTPAQITGKLLVYRYSEKS